MRNNSNIDNNHNHHNNNRSNDTNNDNVRVGNAAGIADERAGNDPSEISQALSQSSEMQANAPIHTIYELTLLPNSSVPSSTADDSDLALSSSYLASHTSSSIAVSNSTASHQALCEDEYRKIIKHFRKTIEPEMESRKRHWNSMREEKQILFASPHGNRNTDSDNLSRPTNVNALIETQQI